MYFISIQSDLISIGLMLQGSVSFLPQLYVYSILKPHSQIKKPSQTATERGEAELRILDFKTTQSEFQKPVRPLSCEAKQSYVHTISKNHNLLGVSPKQLCASAPLGCTRARLTVLSTAFRCVTFATVCRQNNTSLIYNSGYYVLFL